MKTRQSDLILYPYLDEARDILSNIPLYLKEFPRAKPEGTPEGKVVYLTVDPESSPNMGSKSFLNHKANDYLINLIDN